MKLTHSMGILLHTRKDKLNKNGEAPIYLRVTVNGKRAEISCKQFVLPEKWSSEAEKIKGTKEEIKVINNHLLKLKIKAQRIYQQLLEEDKSISPQIIKNKFFGKQNGKTLIQAFEFHNERVKERVGLDYSKSTHKRYETSLMHTKNYLRYEYSLVDLLLSDLNYDFISKFEHYFKTVRKCNHNSTMKYLKNLKTVVNMSIKKEWIQNNPFSKFETKVHETKRTYLSKEELKSIEEKEFKILRLDQIRDFFVFSCYTGYAYSDIEKLKPTDIKTHFDGSKWIITSRTKTDTQSNVPILPKAKEIIDKYKDNVESIRLGKLFPIPSNVKYNAYLKEIADLCNVDKKLSTHVGRHTFATTVTLSNGVSIETVSSMLGHKSLRTTQIYAKVVEEKVSREMNELKNKLG
jgi:site-specific recombinase XerD